jgi:hypothetical protein
MYPIGPEAEIQEFVAHCSQIALSLFHLFTSDLTIFLMTEPVNTSETSDNSYQRTDATFQKSSTFIFAAVRT